jgi:RNA polymerase sigma factor (TIGR02999 family)
MSPHDPVLGDITSQLHRWSAGDIEGLSSVVSLAFNDLRAIAAGYLRRERGSHTLQATALVNELYLRLAGQRHIAAMDRKRFFGLSAMMIRRILSDYARRSLAHKRPGADGQRVPLHEELAWVDAQSEDMLTLDRSLEELEQVDERSVRAVELRFFLGCTSAEAAELLGVSRTTLDNDLEFAKAWLFRRMRSEAHGPRPR